MIPFIDSNIGIPFIKWTVGVGDTPPDYTPHLERAALPKTPGIVKANTPISVYRLILSWFKGWVYGY